MTRLPIKVKVKTQRFLSNTVGLFGSIPFQNGNFLFDISGNCSNYTGGDSNFGDGTKEKEEETVLEEITRKASIGRYGFQITL